MGARVKLVELLERGLMQGIDLALRTIPDADIKAAFLESGFVSPVGEGPQDNLTDWLSEEIAETVERLNEMCEVAVIVRNHTGHIAEELQEEASPT